MTSPERFSFSMYFAAALPNGRYEAGRQILPKRETPKEWEEARPRAKQARTRIRPDVIAISRTDYEDTPSGPGAVIKDYWDITIPSKGTPEAKHIEIDKAPENLDDLQARYRSLGEALQQRFQATGITIFVR